MTDTEHIAINRARQIFNCQINDSECMDKKQSPPEPCVQMSDPIIQEALRAINRIGEFCNQSITPSEPDGARRAVLLFRSLAKPYIDTITDYIASRPKAAFSIPVYRFKGELVPYDEYPD